MQDILSDLAPEDYRFLIGIIQGPLKPCTSLKADVEELVASQSEGVRRRLVSSLENEIRYLGSSDLAYQFRRAMGQVPGRSFRSIVKDTARYLKVPLPTMNTERAMVTFLAQDYATQQFGQLPENQQQRILEELGVERERALTFLKKASGVFAGPVLIEAFGLVVVQGLIKTVLFGMVAKTIGRQLAVRLFAYLFARVPWWAGWISPAAWTLSLSWAALNLQGPARRKTVPIVLFLGMCCLRDGAEAADYI
ncbi:MAG: hypothetical protein OXM02_12975 [Bacteroidota bacterium]|nr:hypothetical protein [Bacteroidota bacterium]MDE2955771.1 hypothetical protein [Bacteroidota bacterium]